jgi:hypothetical protein
VRDLHPLDPLRLSVAVNFSVFLADLVDSPSAAIALAEKVSPAAVMWSTAACGTSCDACQVKWRLPTGTLPETCMVVHHGVMSMHMLSGRSTQGKCQPSCVNAAMFKSAVSMLPHGMQLQLSSGLTCTASCLLVTCAGSGRCCCCNGGG